MVLITRSLSSGCASPNRRRIVVIPDSVSSADEQLPDMLEASCSAAAACGVPQKLVIRLIGLGAQLDRLAHPFLGDAVLLDQPALDRAHPNHSVGGHCLVKIIRPCIAERFNRELLSTQVMSPLMRRTYPVT